MTGGRVARDVRRASCGAALAFAVAALAVVAYADDPEPDPPKTCDSCAAWNAPQAPFRIFGNTWYVGTAGLASILITSPDGDILIDGGLTQSAPLIAANIRTLGFRVEDIKLILNSHTHYDHAGGLAYLAKLSGARVAASPASKRALERGGPAADDPQFGFGPDHNNYPALPKVHNVLDGATLHVGKLAITAHFTPGHTPGGTTWTWRACDDVRCYDTVYADSLNSISAPGYRFTGDHRQPSRVNAFVHSIEVVANLPCDILLAPHPDFIDLQAKLAAWRAHPDANPFVDPGACRAYAAGARQRLDQRVAEERAQ